MTGLDAHNGVPSEPVNRRPFFCSAGQQTRDSHILPAINFFPASTLALNLPSHFCFLHLLLRFPFLLSSTRFPFLLSSTRSSSHQISEQHISESQTLYITFGFLRRDRPLASNGRANLTR